jgi:hypothetical protein
MSELPSPDQVPLVAVLTARAYQENALRVRQHTQRARGDQEFGCWRMVLIVVDPHLCMR